MPYKQNGLTLQVTGFRTYGPPARAFEFELQLFSSIEYPVTAIGSDINVSLGNGEIGRGNLLRVRTAPALGAAAGARGEMVGGITIPLTPEMLAWIEARREGDLEYSINATVLLAPVVQGIQESDGVLGVPWEQPVVNRYSSSIRDKIPQSEWLKHLRLLGWDESLLIEIPAGRHAQRYPQAQQRLDDAMNHYRRGDWEETLASCRKLMEALAAAKTELGAAQPNPKKLREFFDTGEKGDALDNQFLHFGKFLHLGRHEQMTNVKLARRDALFALTVAGALLRYVSE